MGRIVDDVQSTERIWWRSLGQRKNRSYCRASLVSLSTPSQRNLPTIDPSVKIYIKQKKKIFDELMKKKTLLSSTNFPCGHLSPTHSLSLSFGKRSNRIPRSNYRHVWQIVHEFHWTRRVYNYYHQVTHNSDQYHLMSPKLLIVHPDRQCFVIEQLEKSDSIWGKAIMPQTINYLWYLFHNEFHSN